MPYHWYKDPDETRENREEIKRDNEVLRMQEDMKPGVSTLFDEWVKLGKPDEFYSIWLAKRYLSGSKG